MKISFNWLKEFVKIDKTPLKLAEVLTLSGTEVEGVQPSVCCLDKVVVGEIMTIIKHTNADKLRVCKVRVKKDVVLNIVCGAPNIQVGQKVPVALVGATLPGGILEKTKIRGIESEGMLLAEDEMGLGHDHAGIYLLDKKEPIGKSIKAVLGLNDTVLDLALTPNRADCFSVLGIAREVAAATGRKLNFIPDKLRLSEKTSEISKKLSVKVLDTKLCPKYTARVIENLEIMDSPEWLKARLRASGVRPINNIVDVTNYVMLELGQPLHAFDFDKLSGAKSARGQRRSIALATERGPASGWKSIIVRRANKGEKLVTLDGKERELDQNMLLITEGKKNLGIAGVMGGQSSEISSKTKTVILESAIFDPSNIRKTARKLNLRSESEMRFEKGLDYEMTELAADRAAALMVKLGKGRVIPGLINISPEKNRAAAVVNLPLLLIKRYLNINLVESKVKLILKSLGFEIISSKGKVLKVSVPSWRPDVRIPEDLVEEIGRLYDYNKLKPTYLEGTLKPVDLPKSLIRENEIKDILVSAGLCEVYNYSFYGEDLARKFNLNPESHYKVSNPINPDQALMRQSLIPLLIKNLELNRGGELFEIGHTFAAKEETKLALAVFGQDAFFRLKGLADLIGNKLNLDKDISAKLFKLAPLSPVLVSAFKFIKPVAYLEVNLNELIINAKDKPAFAKPNKYPAMTRDISFFKPKEIAYQNLANEIKTQSDLITDLEVFDRFEKEGQTSLAVRLTFQGERTLKGEEVDSVMDKIYALLEGKFKIKVRK